MFSVIEITSLHGISFVDALFTRPCLEMDEFGKIFFALFHAISAFCNAGFSTLHDNLADSTIIDISPFYVIISLLIVAEIPLS